MKATVLALVTLTLLASIQIFAETKQTLNIQYVDDDPGKACNIAFGMYRRQAKDFCKKINQDVNYDTLDAGTCKQTKIADKKFQANYKVTFECKK